MSTNLKTQVENFKEHIAKLKVERADLSKTNKKLYGEILENRTKRSKMSESIKEYVTKIRDARKAAKAERKAKAQAKKSEKKVAVKKPATPAPAEPVAA